VTRPEWTRVLFALGWAALWLVLAAIVGPSNMDGIHPSYYAVI
jgi:hypothetical protein